MVQNYTEFHPYDQVLKENMEYLGRVHFDVREPQTTTSLDILAERTVQHFTL